MIANQGESKKLIAIAAALCVPTALHAVGASEPLSPMNCIILLVLSAATVAVLMLMAGRTKALTPKVFISIAILFSILIRIIIAAASPGHASDMSCFTFWSQSAANGGLSNFYTSGTFADYPPGYVYVLFLVGKVTNLLGVDPFSVLGSILVRLPAMLCDVGLALILYKTARKKLSESAAQSVLLLVALNPLLVLNSAAWGQVDSVLSLILVITFILLFNKKFIPAAAAYGLAVLVKPQALIAGPVFGMCFLYNLFKKDQTNRLKALFDIIAGAVLALGIVFLLGLPFQGTQDTFWVFERIFNTAGSYPWASVNAFNLFSLLGGNWVKDSQIVLGLSWKTWGMLGIVFSLCITTLFAVISAKKKTLNFELLGALFLTLVFTFAHNMHERYLVPALFLMMLAYCRTGEYRLKRAYAYLSGALFLNVGAVLLCSFYECYHLIGGMQWAVSLFSALYIISAAYFVWMCFDIMILGRTKTKPGEII